MNSASNVRELGSRSFPVKSPDKNTAQLTPCLSLGRPCVKSPANLCWAPKPEKLRSNKCVLFYANNFMANNSVAIPLTDTLTSMHIFVIVPLPYSTAM